MGEAPDEIRVEVTLEKNRPSRAGGGQERRGGGEGALPLPLTDRSNRQTR